MISNFAPQLILHFDGARIEGIRPFATVEYARGKWRWTQLSSLSNNAVFAGFPGTNGSGDGTAFFAELRRVAHWAQKYFSRGGAIGATSYEFAGRLGDYPFLAADFAPIPDVRYTFCEQLQRSELPVSAPRELTGKSTFPMTPEYGAAIAKIQEYIRAGDIYQANYVRQFEADLSAAPRALFDALWNVHPMPFSAFLDWGDLAIVSNSPERFIRVQNGVIQAEPIKGTCRRGKNKSEDERLKVLLAESPKNRAENVMITDLMRNDLGRVCDFGSVRVAALCQLRSFPTLHHLVSVIQGNLRQNIDALDAFAATFPCGSITGAPKIRSMEIIHELEPAPRGIFMGAIGYLDFHGNADWNVAIRTIVCREKKAYFCAGGGITADSVAAEEWDEMQLKASAIRQMIAPRYLRGGDSTKIS